MKFLKMIFLTLVFVLGLYLVTQNIQVLERRLNLGLDLWLAQWDWGSIAVYVLLSISFILGLLFAILIFHPKRPETSQELQLLKAKSSLLQQELSTLQQETSQELQQRQPAGSQQETAPGAQDTGALAGSIWAKTALLGILGLFILLTVFYYYTDNQLQELSQGLSAEQEKTRELQDSLQQKTSELSEQSQELQSRLADQKKQIQELHRIPQQTRDYLTAFHLQDYIQEIKQLEQEAEAGQDRENLEQAREAISSALEHYLQKRAD
ncbi:MAG: hypothetical protein ACLFMQ_04145 [Desulfohalobiaceae bacterium]